MTSEAFFKMSYGIYLISSKYENDKCGYIANTAFQVTAEPPQIAISCHKDNTSATIIEKSGVFAVSVLEKNTDAGLIGLFGYQSGNEEEKFERVSYLEGKNGAPVITTHAVAYFECKVVDKFDVGSHYLFIGEVTEGELLAPEKDSLTYKYFRDEMKLMAPERAPTYIDKSKLALKNDQSDLNKKEEDFGPNFICPICAYVYEPAIGDDSQGIAEGTPFADLPEDWVCPICAAAKSVFISEN
ncbi:MAG: flavin reductase [Bacteroidales bacterium]|nr:flavin reductase [Bacteroidales bacterium]